MIPDKDTQQGTHLSGAPLNGRHDRQNQVQSLEEQQRSHCPDVNGNVKVNLSTHSPEEQQGPDCPEPSVLSTYNPVISDRHYIYLFDVSSPSSSSSEEEDVATDDVDSEPTSDSKDSTASSVSFKSDESKGILINFKGQLSPRSDLSFPSSSSSEEEDVAPNDVDSEPTSDSKDSTASHASDKSDRSKGRLINFKGQLSPRVSRKCRASTGSRCASMKSEGSPGCINAKKRHSGPDFTSSSSSSSSSSSEEDVAAVDGDDDMKNDMTSLPADHYSAASEGM